MTIDDVGVVLLRRVAAKLNANDFAIHSRDPALTSAQWIARARRADLRAELNSAGVTDARIVEHAEELREPNETPIEPKAPPSTSATSMLAEALDAVLAQSKTPAVNREQVLEIVREEMLKLPARTLVEIKTDGRAVEMKGLQHARMPRLLRYMGRNKNIMLVGPPGTGKSTAAALAADALGLAWSAKSVTGQSMETDFLGYRSPNGDLVRTGFRDRYEQGGVFILDEVDKGNPNVLGVLQTALSNGFCAFPDGMVKQHATFCVVATANTWGNGRTAAYVGSNALDGAFLNRFARIHWPIDEALEEALTLAQGGETAACWLAYVRRVRAAFEQTTLKVIISPRQSINGAEMLAHGLEWSEVVEDYLSGGLSDEALSVLNKVQR